MMMAAVPLIGQNLSRTNDKEVEVEILTSLDFARGYMLIDGDWLSFDRNENVRLGHDLEFNAIPNQYFFNSDGSYMEFSLSRSMNFGEISISEANYDGKSFMVLHYDKMGGRYKYPSLNEGWYEFEEEYIYLIDPNDWVKFKTELKGTINQAKNFPFKSLSHEKFRNDLDKDDLDKRIRKVINKSPSSFIEYLDFQYFPVDIDGEKFVRFNLKNETAFGKNFPPFDPLIFDKYYFEVNYEDFMRFLDK